MNTLLPFQETAIQWALSRDKSYLALDPGLGKTIIAASIARALPNIHVYYICPPFLVKNTQYEFDKWAPGTKLTIIPDSKLHTFHYAPEQDDEILFLDEAHRVKSDSARRTKAFFKLAEFFTKIVYLSGTPVPNRPMELFTILKHSAPETIQGMDKFDYGMRYCAGFQRRIGTGQRVWDFTGASNVPELATKVKKNFMLRMRKEDVLKELPPKTEEVVIIGEDLTPALTQMDKQILKILPAKDLIKGAFFSEDLHISTYRKELGLLKAEASIKYIKYLLTETEENILVFAHHKAVIEKLKEEMAEYDPVVISGETKIGDRNDLVQTFQNQKEHRLFIGNILAAGVGFTLTKATRVIFVEFSWVPGDNIQASDRAHRIGQKNNVLVQYLVYKNSIDRTVIEAILNKQQTTEKI